MATSDYTGSASEITPPTRTLTARSADPIAAEVQNEISTARVHEDVLRIVAEEYSNLPASERDGRNAFSGIMTRDTYTKAAHLACLRDMVPHGKITLVSEQEAAMARVVPHVYRDEILQDRFEWHVVSFDKEATKPTILRRTAGFKTAFRAYRQARPDIAPWEALEGWTAEHLSPAFKEDRQGAALPFPISNFASMSWPALWLHSPVQVAGETEKVVGFPILSPRYRQDYRKLGLQASVQPEAHDDLRAAIARRAIAATLQPAATFMNSLRERVSFARRSGGRGSRKGPSFINGACYNPRVLIAALNIYRVHYNFFEKRQYVSPLNRHAETEDVGTGTTTITAPGTGARIRVPKRRTSAPIQRTPAMRAGIQPTKQGEKMPPLPVLKRVLYQPWLFHGTPLWNKLQGR